MKHKFLLVPLIFASLLIIRCGNNSTKQTNSVEANPVKDTVVIAQGSNAKGVGRFKDVALTHPLDANMIAKAEAYLQRKMLCMSISSLPKNWLDPAGKESRTEEHLSGS
jgi:hypothetical protein